MISNEMISSVGCMMIGLMVKVVMIVVMMVGMIVVDDSEFVALSTVVKAGMIFL